MAKNQPEQKLHIAVARYLTVALPKDAWFTTIPAGGGGARRGAYLKAMGYKAGTPDLQIIYQGRVLFVELKASNGRVTDAQWKTKDHLLAAGAYWCVCKTLDELASALTGWNVPLRAKL